MRNYYSKRAIINMQSGKLADWSQPHEPDKERGYRLTC